MLMVSNKIHTIDYFKEIAVLVRFTELTVFFRTIARTLRFISLTSRYIFNIEDRVTYLFARLTAIVYGHPSNTILW